MKSSTGQYYIGLDHIRAVAAFMVFSWHFMHLEIPHTYTPAFIPFSLFNEGHTGVSLFMTLSGYLFAKLLDGKRIRYIPFLWNRFLRLAPLLFFVVTIIGIHQYSIGVSPELYCLQILKGVILPILPNGAWSITVEFHFYLLLPILLYLSRKSKYALGLIVCCAILVRFLIYQKIGLIQPLAYWTILGRIDQFLLGMIGFQMRNYIKGRHLLVLTGFALFSIYFWYFDRAGGYHHNPTYPSRRSFWVYFTTVEGLAYGLIIAWYDNSFTHSQNRFSRFIALIGTYSYSIYLLHQCFYEIHLIIFSRYIMPVTNIYIAFCYALLGFLLMVPVGYLSFRLIESPFLRLRTKYVIDQPADTVLQTQAVEETEALQP